VKRIARTIAQMACAAAALGAAGDAPLVVREQLWMAPTQDASLLLAEAPECMAAASIEAEAGRALFRSPFVLGGPAARIGLSCHACHTNGARNAAFFLPELTDRAGAADVTSSWSSAVRGDGVLNPRDIPSLVDAAQRDAFGAGETLSLHDFIRGVVVEEFQGAGDPTVIAALTAYVAALERDACPSPARTRAPLSVGSAADDVRRAVAALPHDPTQAAVALAARDIIGRIVERLPQRRFARERAALEASARALAHPQALLAEEGRMTAWRAQFDGTIAAIARRERETYFDEATLAQALAAPTRTGR